MTKTQGKRGLVDQQAADRELIIATPAVTVGALADKLLATAHVLGFGDLSNTATLERIVSGGTDPQKALVACWWDALRLSHLPTKFEALDAKFAAWRAAYAAHLAASKAADEVALGRDNTAEERAAEEAASDAEEAAWTALAWHLCRSPAERIRKATFIKFHAREFLCGREKEAADALLKDTLGVGEPC